MMSKLIINGKAHSGKSILISRNKFHISENEKDDKINDGLIKPEYKYTIVVKLFAINDPHSKLELPIKEFDFENITITQFIEFGELNFLTLGSDLLINNINNVEIKIDNDTLLIINKK